MLQRTAFALQSQSRVLLRTQPTIPHRAPFSSSKMWRKDEQTPKDPMRKRDTDTKPYVSEQTRSGRHEDIAMKDTSYDPSQTDPKQQKKNVAEEEVSPPSRKPVDKQSGRDESGSLDFSPAEEDISKDYDKSREEVASSRQRADPSVFVQTPNHVEEVEGDLSAQNTSRDKFKRLRSDKSEEPDYYQP